MASDKLIPATEIGVQHLPNQTLALTLKLEDGRIAVAPMTNSTAQSLIREIKSKMPKDKTEPGYVRVRRRKL